MHMPLVELAWLAAAVVVAGAVSGLLAGLFGIGGGAVIVPVLYQAFAWLGVVEAVRMQLAVGTSLAIIVPTALRAYRTHLQHDLVVGEVIRQWWLPAIVGVAVGAGAAAVAPAGLFEAAFALIATVIAAKLLFGRDRWVLSHTLPGRPAMAGYGFLVGLASSLMGISGGSVVTMILTLHGKSIHNAVATAAGLGVPVAVAGTIGYAIAGLAHRAELPPLSVGFVSLIGVVAMAPLSSYVAPLGARLAHRLRRRTLEIAFGMFLLAAAARFVVALG